MTKNSNSKELVHTLNKKVLHVSIFLGMNLMAPCSQPVGILEGTQRLPLLHEVQVIAEEVVFEDFMN